MPPKLRIYSLLIIILGFLSLFQGALEFRISDLPVLIFFSILGIIAESVAIKVNKNISISVTFGIGFASVLVFQTAVVAIICFITVLFAVKIDDGKVIHILNSSIYKKIFNCSSYAISLTIATYVYEIIDDYTNLMISSYNVLSIIAAIIVFSVLDISIFVVLISILENKSFVHQFIENSWLIINVIALSPLGILIAILFNGYGMFAVILFFGPLLLARYSFKLYVDMKMMYSETIFALSNAVDAKDQYTNGHAHRVADYAVEIARRMKFSESDIEKIKTAAILHDIGKIGIQDMILNKPGRLTDQEFEEIKKHPTIGATILAQVHNLKEVVKIIKYHHERYDGKGYPEGISGDLVPIESYIISVSDAFDAMTSDRPYRFAMDRATAVGIITEEKGKQFHPKVVEAFLKYINEPKES